MVSKQFGIKVGKNKVMNFYDSSLKLRTVFSVIGEQNNISNTDVLKIITLEYLHHHSELMLDDKIGDLQKQIEMEVHNMKAKGYRRFAYNFPNAIKYIIEMLGTETMPIKTVKRNIEILIPPNTSIDPDNKTNWEKLSRMPMTRLKEMRTKIIFLMTRPPFLEIKRIQKYSFERIKAIEAEWNGYAVGEDKKRNDVIDIGGEKWQLKNKRE